MHYLSQVKNKDFITKIFDLKTKLEVNIIDAKGNYPLHYAAAARNDFLIEKLIQASAKINVQNDLGLTPVHMSLYNYKEHKDHTPKIERMLIRAGSDLNIEDIYGRTALFCLYLNSYPKYDSSDETSDPANMTL